MLAGYIKRPDGEMLHHVGAGLAVPEAWRNGRRGAERGLGKLRPYKGQLLNGQSSAASTSSTCPSTETFGNTFLMRPSLPITMVVRSTPMYFLP